MLLVSTALALGLIGQTSNQQEDINRDFLAHALNEGFQIVRTPLEHRSNIDPLSFVGRIDPRNDETCESVFGDHFKSTTELGPVEVFFEYTRVCGNQCWVTNQVLQQTQTFKGLQSKLRNEVVTTTRVVREEDRAVAFKEVDEGLASCRLVYLQKSNAYSRSVKKTYLEGFPYSEETFWNGLAQRFDLSGNLVFWNVRQRLVQTQYHDFGLFGPQRMTTSRKVYAATGP